MPDPVEPQATPSSGPSAAVRAAVDALVGEGGGAAEQTNTADAQATQEGAAAAAVKSEFAAAAPAETQPKVEERGGELEQLQAFAKAQDRWGRERDQLRAQAQGATDSAKKQIIAALQSDDPDGALERLGLDQGQRRRLVERMVLRHVPKDKADPELARRIEIEEARAEARAANARLDKYIQEQKEERERERQQATIRQQAEAALQTLHDAFQNAGDDLRQVRKRYSKKRDATVKDAIDVGKQLAAKGEISSRMSEKDIAKKIVAELNRQYREDFDLEDAPAAQAAAKETAPATQRASTHQNAAEMSAARTISRGATEVTRPPPSQSPPRNEDEWLAEEAALMAKKRREGFFNQAS